MNAMTEPVHFTMPKKPRVIVQEPMPDQRKVCVLPIRAINDKRLSHGAFHVLAAICSYCNRAGITWVSQVRLAKDLQITQQAVAKQCKQLRDCGYLETIRKGFKAQRTDTLRVIFDPSVDADTAMSVTSSVEDTRSPQIKQEQAMQAEEADKEGQARVAREVSKVLKQPTKRIKTMPKSGETITVKNMKAAIQKAQNKHQQPVDNSGHLQPAGCNENSSYYNPQVVPVNNLQVVHNTDILTRGIQLDKQVVEEVNLNKLDIQPVNCGLEVLHNQHVDELIAGGLTTAWIADALDTLLPLYEAEGITPTSAVLMAGIKQMQADVK